MKGTTGAGSTVTDWVSFPVGAAIHLAIVWHHHQPLYRDLSPGSDGVYSLPWVRLHALRDSYGMAAIVAQHPEIHLTINFSGVLLEQFLEYAEQRAWDRALRTGQAWAINVQAPDAAGGTPMTSVPTWIKVLDANGKVVWDGVVEAGTSLRVYPGLVKEPLRAELVAATGTREEVVHFEFKDVPVPPVNGAGVPGERTVRNRRGTSSPSVSGLPRRWTRMGPTLSRSVSAWMTGTFGVPSCWSFACSRLNSRRRSRTGCGNRRSTWRSATRKGPLVGEVNRPTNSLSGPLSLAPWGAEPGVASFA